MSNQEYAYLLEADLHARVSSRCRRAYLHDLRDGLQAISGAVDLLARSTTTGSDNRLLIDRASDLSRRALAAYETSIASTLDDLLIPGDAPAPVAVGDLIHESMKFLRNDAASKEISIRFTRAEEATLRVPRRKLRMLILGLLTAAIDRLPAGEEIRIEVGRAEDGATIDISAKVSFADPDGGTGPVEWLAVTVARNFYRARGGRLEIDEIPGGAHRLRLAHPAPMDDG